MPAADPAGDGATVDLTDLEVIRRFSLAVRQGTATRADVVAALTADLDRLGAPVPASSRPRPAKPSPTGRGTAGRARTAPTSRG